MTHVPVIAFFNNKGGVGKTTIVQHLAFKYTSEGHTILVADLDPQANLTSVFLEEETLIRLWNIDKVKPPKEAETIFEAVEPQIDRTGDIIPITLQPVLSTEIPSDTLWLIPGDLRLSYFEDTLSGEWAESIIGKAGGLRVTSAFWRILQNAAKQCQASFILVDMGPNLGAINRAALISSDFVIIPMSSDMFSLQGLRNLGPTIRKWSQIWSKILATELDIDFELPTGSIQALGYIITQHNEQLSKPVKAYQQWIDRIPSEYRKYVLGEADSESDYPTSADPNFLGFVRHYRSLGVMAQEARKPIFFLRPADGAVGAHTKTVKDADQVFGDLAATILHRFHSDLEQS